MIQSIDIFSDDFGAKSVDGRNPGLIPAANQSANKGPILGSVDIDIGGDVASQDAASAKNSEDMFILQQENEKLKEERLKAEGEILGDNAPTALRKQFDGKSQGLGSQLKGEGFEFQGNEAGNLLEFVRGFEGFAKNAADDFGQISIGFGTKARPGEKSITLDEANRRLKGELGSHRRRVVDAVKQGGFNFSETQIDALTSFDFNTGAVRQVLLNKDGSQRFNRNEDIAAKIKEFNKVTENGKKRPLRGLTRRRNAEANIFLNNKF